MQMSADNPNKDDTIPFYPDHILTEFWVAVGLLVIIIIIGMVGMFSPVGIGDPADPMDTPTHVKPEWYFLALYQLLKFIPKSAGAVGPVIALILLTLLPFIDSKPDKSKKSQRIRFFTVLFLLVISIGLTIWGEVS
jgi:quinol-cytochrome oxidoreductase complex cytochrome b subunit